MSNAFYFIDKYSITIDHFETTLFVVPDIFNLHFMSSSTLTYATFCKSSTPYNQIIPWNFQCVCLILIYFCFESSILFTDLNTWVTLIHISLAIQKPASKIECTTHEQTHISHHVIVYCGWTEPHECISEIIQPEICVRLFRPRQQNQYSSHRMCDERTKNINVQKITNRDKQKTNKNEKYCCLWTIWRIYALRMIQTNTVDNKTKQKKERKKGKIKCQLEICIGNNVAMDRGMKAAWHTRQLQWCTHQFSCFWGIPNASKSNEITTTTTTTTTSIENTHTTHTHKHRETTKTKYYDKLYNHIMALCSVDGFY